MTDTKDVAYVRKRLCDASDSMSEVFVRVEDMSKENKKLKELLKQARSSIESLSDLLRQAKEELDSINPDSDDGTTDIAKLIFCIDCELKETTDEI